MTVLIRDAVALYVDPQGPYPSLVADWYDAERDATTYSGPWPVVAHPPCGPWGNLRHFCKYQDPKLGPIAVEQVNTFGGVLEHPAHSKLWEHCGLPKPGHPSIDGWTLQVEQWWWGHRAIKKTWLYIVGTEDVPQLPEVMGSAPRDSRPGGMVQNKLSKKARRLTPQAFAEWLVNLAQMCA